MMDPKGALLMIAVGVALVVAGAIGMDMGRKTALITEIEVIKEKPVILLEGMECDLVQQRDMVSGDFGPVLRYIQTQDKVEVMILCPNELFFHYVPAE